MGGLFSKEKPRASKKTELGIKDKAVLDLKRARDRLDKARKKTELEQATYVSKARMLLQSGKKDQAKLALRMKKYKATQLEKVTLQLSNLEQMVNDVEWAHHQVEIVEGMKAGNLALKELQLDADEVADIMAETQEAMAKQQEIDDIISGSLSNEDEEDVLAELDMIEQEEAAHLDFDLPNAPNDSVETVKAPVIADERHAVLS